MKMGDLTRLMSGSFRFVLPMGLCRITVLKLEFFFSTTAPRRPLRGKRVLFSCFLRDNAGGGGELDTGNPREKQRCQTRRRLSEPFRRS